MVKVMEVGADHHGFKPWVDDTVKVGDPVYVLDWRSRPRGQTEPMVHAGTVATIGRVYVKVEWSTFWESGGKLRESKWDGLFNATGSQSEKSHAGSIQFCTPPQFDHAVEHARLVDELKEAGIGAIRRGYSNERLAAILAAAVGPENHSKKDCQTT